MPKSDTPLDTATHRRLMHITLLIFAKCPDAGRCKTRLIKGFGEEGAVEVHRRLTVKTFQETYSLNQQRRVSIQIHYTGEAVDELRALANEHCPQGVLIEQRGDDLGSRLHNAFASALSSSEAAIAIGTDCPFLDSQLLFEACATLESNQAVIGPAADGGYYLLGLRAPHPELFQNIDWGTSAVLEQTLIAGAAVGLHFDHLPILSDVDDPEDVTQEVRQLLHMPDIEWPNEAR
ncbi:MAG: TIGR04282 family arsenosugar biosynthesis glycosyltransferase [Planctomycetaceae bacterium]|nr:TIGR04282 family arsenosugar biosynthesis glycosyltransferase [Planctomycetaceae bacterium]MCB9949421.1 TIGR04282 family arsenosugar biosynthesis glycosyltransferase [Planctomycetaceae bacterium]